MTTLLAQLLTTVAALLVGAAIGFKEGQTDPDQEGGLPIAQVRWLVEAYKAGHVIVLNEREGCK